MNESTRRKEYSQDMRLRCVAKAKQGFGANKIARDLDMPKSTVKSIIHSHRMRGHTFNLPRSGRPRITDERTDRRIVRAVEANRFASAAAIAVAVLEEVGHPVKPTTVRNRLKASGLNGRSSRKKPFLSKVHKRRRLAYAKRMLASLPQQEDWADVLFTDEASVQLNGSTGKVSVWRRTGEAFAEKCTTPTQKNVRTSLMVWSSISSRGVGTIHFCERTVNGEYYWHLLQEKIPITRALLGLPTPTPFVQDNAPAHRAKLTKNCVSDLQLTNFMHPPQSPDLNPIENLWAVMKSELHKNPASSVVDLKVKLKEIWHSIYDEIVKKC